MFPSVGPWPNPVRNSSDSGLLIEAHFVAWKDREYVSYVMVRGFPLRGYFASMAIHPLDEGAVLFTWSVYYTTQEITDDEFAGIF